MLTVAGYNSQTNQITATSAANNPILGNVQVLITFMPGAYPGFDLTLTPSGGQACTIAEDYVASGASSSPTLAPALLVAALLAALSVVVLL